MAFAVGSAVDIPVAHSFCVYAAWSFLANDILQFLVFVPLMVMDNRRISKKRNCCCPCICGHGRVDVSNDNGIESGKNVSNNANSRNVDGESDQNTHHSASSAIISPTVRSLETTSNLSKVLLPVMTKRVPRLLIILLFLCTLFGSIYVIPSVRTESVITNYYPDDSIVIEFLRQLDVQWDGFRTNELDVVIKNQDFSNIAVRDAVHELVADLESHDDAFGAVLNWLDEFEAFVRDIGRDIDNMNSSEFYRELQLFSNGTSWESEIIYDDPQNPTQIDLTRFTLKVSGASQFSAVFFEYTRWNEIFDEYFPSDSAGFVFFEYSLLGYLQHNILSLTATNMLFSGIGVCFVLMFFVDLRMTLFILIILSSIDVHLMAWMWAFDISLDGVAYIDLVMAVGLTVDYLIHIIHSIVEAQPEGDISKMSQQEIYAAKLKIAFDAMGFSVWFVLCELSSSPVVFCVFIPIHQQQGCPHYVFRSGDFDI